MEDDESISDYCVHTLDAPSVVASCCSGRLFHDGDMVCAFGKQSGISIVRAETGGIDLRSELCCYDRLEHVYTLKIRGVERLCSNLSLPAPKAPHTSKFLSLS
jgi:hypothetical protein